MVRCKPYEILRTVNVVQGLHIHKLHPLVVGYIPQLFRDILRILINTSAGAPFPVVSLVCLVGNAVIGAIQPDGHGLQGRHGTPVDRIFQNLDGRFLVFHLNFAIRYYAVKFLLRNTPRALLIRQIMRHVIVEPVGIRDNDINHPFQIVEETDENIPAPRIIGGPISTSRTVRDDEHGKFPVRNTKRPGITVSGRGDMEPPCLHRVECKPVRKERLPAVIFPRSNQLLGIAPLFRRRARHLDIESPVLIVAHYGQALELALNTNQPFQQTAANDNLPMLPFAQHIQVRGIQANLLRQIGKEFSIYALSFVHLCMLIKSQ